MPHFISPGQVAPRAPRRRVPLRPCSTGSATPTRTTRACARSLALDDAEDALVRLDPGYPRRAAHLPARRLPRRPRRQVPRVQRRLAGRHRLHRRAPRGRSRRRSSCRAVRDDVRHRVRADAAAARRDPPRRLPARRGRRTCPKAPALALVDVPGSPSVPEFRITCAAAARPACTRLHATTDELDYDGSTLRAGRRAGPARVPPRPVSRSSTPTARSWPPHATGAP